ncbi:Vps5 C terminal like-domain-containing protein [Globomyces pollinis-pini]|nr:Vps5 C terminal like-domain-containing protein [Globomyces pollinis-pini]
MSYDENPFANDTVWNDQSSKKNNWELPVDQHWGIHDNQQPTNWNNNQSNVMDPISNVMDPIVNIEFSNKNNDIIENEITPGLIPTTNTEIIVEKTPTSAKEIPLHRLSITATTMSPLSPSKSLPQMFDPLLNPDDQITTLHRLAEVTPDHTQSYHSIGEIDEENTPLAYLSAALSARSSAVQSPLKPFVQKPSSLAYSDPSIVNTPKLTSLLHYFDIQVSDPLKVGDKISGYVEYRIKTKTSNPDYARSEFYVMRRFSDFLWLYNQLLNKYPGVIVPPIPEKMAMGRFQEDFIESRRYQLERFMIRVTKHHILQLDDNLQFFLEAEQFTQERKLRTTKPILGAESVPLVNQPCPPVPDNDKVLDKHRSTILQLDSQLKAFAKHLDILLKQRKELAICTNEMADHLLGFGSLEITGRVGDKLKKLSNIHKQIAQFYERQSRDETIYIANTVEEYVRLIGSAKVAFAIRLKLFNDLTNMEQTLAKKRESLLKYQQSSKLRVDKINIYRDDVNESERLVEEGGLEFQKVTKRLVEELSAFEHSKINDFKNAMKLFLNEMLQNQKAIIGLWESYSLEPMSSTTTPV